MKKRQIRIVQKKLGREHAVGMHVMQGLIEIDPRLKPYSRLTTLVHELLHEVCPRWSETRVTRAAPTIAKTLWRDGYRKP